MTCYLDEPFELIHLTETDSTSNYLRKLLNADNAKEYTVVAADFQTSGKGQRGNSWESEREKNLLFSLLLTPAFLPANEQFVLSQIISLSIKEELDTYCSEISIKWPNDIYWKNKKICGILIEHDLQGKNLSQTIAGIGININQEFFSSPAPNPVSLKQITGEEYDLCPILRNILTRIYKYYSEIQYENTGNLADRYYEALFRKGRLARYSDKDGEFTAQIIRVEPSGILVVKDEKNKERMYAFKEISYIL